MFLNFYKKNIKMFFTYMSQTNDRVSHTTRPSASVK